MAGNQTTLLNTASLPEFTDLVERNWVASKGKLRQEAKQLFINSMIMNGTGGSRIYNEVDSEMFADAKGEGQNSTKSKNGIGYSKTMYARTFSKEVDITLEERVQFKDVAIKNKLISLNGFCENREELDLTHRFTFATATSYTDKNGYTVDTSVGDGLALLSTTHTLAFSSTTYSNRVTGDPAFSQGSYESALLLLATQSYSNFGELINVEPNVIITHNDPSTIRQVRQLLESTADTDAVQAGIKNVYAGTMKHVVLTHLATTASGAYDSTKRRYWFVASVGTGINDFQAYLGEWVSPTLKTPANGNNGEDIHNYNWTYSAYCMYGIAILSGRGIVGSAVSS
jgi:hypothetical protein